MPCHCEGCEWSRGDRERAANKRAQAGERCHGQENIGAVRRGQDGNRGPPAVTSLSVSGHLPPLSF